MSVRRILLFLIGVLVAGALLMFLLPFLGVPSSHFLPPSRVYAGAQGEAKGAIVSKYYDETGNPFHVGRPPVFPELRVQRPHAAGARHDRSRPGADLHRDHPRGQGHL